MAPLASEPRQLLIILNLARRKALYQLVNDITKYMRHQVEQKDPASSNSGSDRGWNDEKDNSFDDDALLGLRRAALTHFDTWQGDVLAKLKEILSVPDDGKIVEERRNRTERLSQRRVEVPAAGENLIDFGDPPSATNEAEKVKKERAVAVSTLRGTYHPIPTRLTSIPQEDREETLSCVLLLLLAAGKYAAESRTLVVYLASALELPLSVVDNEEVEIATSLVEASAKASSQQASSPTTMSAEAEALKRKQENQASRYWKVGLASVAGAAIIGVTGGLAAPVVAGAIGGIMGSVGLGGVASFLGIFWMNGALVGTLFGAFGARMTVKIQPTDTVFD
jgi:hypothetical protein